MSQLHWQEKPEKKMQSSAFAGVNLWFGVSMGLIGVIAGFLLTSFLR